MKVTTTETKDFTPFELTIKIESLDELKVLWACLNSHPTKAIKEFEKDYEWLKEINRSGSLCYELWDTLDEKLIELGVKQ